MDGYTIRKATLEDVQKVHAWLKQEHEAGIEGCFLSKFSLIEKGQTTGSLTVVVRDSDSLPVAFCLGENNLELLAVKADCRKQGLGRYLAEHFVKDAHSRNIIGLHGECSPRSSKPFWRAIGFHSVSDPSGSEKAWVALPYVARP